MITGEFFTVFFSENEIHHRTDRKQVCWSSSLFSETWKEKEYLVQQKNMKCYNLGDGKSCI